MVANPILSEHVFASGLHKPIVSNIMSYMYPQYYMTALLDLVGAKKPSPGRVFSWFEQNRTRRNIQLTSIDSADGAATLTVSTIAGDANYAVVGDVYRTASGTMVRVRSVTDSDTFVLEKLDGTVFSAGAGGTDINASSLSTELLGHVTTAFEEGSSAPNGRIFRPEEKYNYMHILRRTAKVTGSELTNVTYLNDKAWFYEVEKITGQEFMRDKEGLLMFGVLGIESGATDLSDSNATYSRGIWDLVLNNGGQLRTYASASGVQESDFQALATDLAIAAGSAAKEYTVLCGADFYADAQRFLKDYAIDGALSYGQFGENVGGLNFTAYKFFNKTFNLVHYEMFDDVEMLPYSATPTAARFDFSKVGLFLDLGIGSVGEPLVQMHYKALGDVNREMVYNYQNGQTGKNNGGEVSTLDDTFTSAFLSECGIEVRMAHRHGILYANS